MTSDLPAYRSETAPTIARRRGLARLAHAALLGCVLLAPVFSGAAPAAPNPNTMSPAEIETMQRRLRELGCPAGSPGLDARSAVREMLKHCPDPTPFLSIETGRPTMPVRRVVADAECRLAATVGYDKTVRLWSLPDGAPLRVARFPFATGDEFDGLAMSPDGRWIAAGGWDAREDENTVFLWDTQTDQPIRTIARSGNQIGALAYSLDGRRLAIAAGDDGIRILDMPDGKTVATDAEYADSTNGLVFGPDGSLFAASYDGSVRRYDANGARTHKTATMSGRKPYTIAVSRDGRTLSVGFADSSRVEILDARTLALVKLTDTARWQDDNISRVGWDADDRIVAGGDTDRPASPLHVFDRTGRHLRDLAPVHYLLDLQPCGRSMILSAVEPTLALLHPDGTLQKLVESDAADMRFKTGAGFKVSADGTKVKFNAGFGATGTPLVIDIANGTVPSDIGTQDGLFGPVTDTLAVDRGSGAVSPGKRAQAPADGPDYSGRTLAIRPDRDGFLLGSWSSVRSFDGQGKQRWKGKLATPVGGVQLAANGSLAIVAYLDGTIRWYRWSDGVELLAAFVNRRDRRFVAWTPSGYYAGSPDAETMFGWQFNGNWSRQADFLPATSMPAPRLHRPDVIRRVLPLLDEAQAVKAADAAENGRL